MYTIYCKEPATSRTSLHMVIRIAFAIMCLALSQPPIDDTWILIQCDQTACQAPFPSSDHCVDKFLQNRGLPLCGWWCDQVERGYHPRRSSFQADVCHCHNSNNQKAKCNCQPGMVCRQCRWYGAYQTRSWFSILQWISLDNKLITKKRVITYIGT